MTDLVLDSIHNFPKQINQVIDDFKKTKLNPQLASADNIIISGMGGSLFSYYIINNFYRSSLKKPFYSVNDYNNPGFLNDKSLFIASSYSGTTEEVIETTK